MSSADHEKAILEVLAFLAAAYPNANVTAATTAAYVKMLADLNPRVLHAAAMQHVAESKFFPTVAELRERAQAIVEASQGGRPPEPAEAWGQALAALRAFSPHYDPPEKIAERTAHLHPLVRRAVEWVGGWKVLAECRQDQVGVLRAHFMRAYEAARARHAEDCRLHPQVRKAIAGLARALTDGGGDGEEEA